MPIYIRNLRLEIGIFDIWFINRLYYITYFIKRVMARTKGDQARNLDIFSCYCYGHNTLSNQPNWRMFGNHIDLIRYIGSDIIQYSFNPVQFISDIIQYGFNPVQIETGLDYRISKFLNFSNFAFSPKKFSHIFSSVIIGFLSHLRKNWAFFATQFEILYGLMNSQRCR